MTDRIDGVSSGWAGVGIDEEYAAMGRLADGGASESIADLASELASDSADLSALAGSGGVGTASARSGAPATAASRIGAAYVADGWSGVDALLDGDPALVRELALSDRASAETEVAAGIERARGPAMFGGTRAAWGADAIMDRLEERFVPMAREAVRREAVDGIDRLVGALDGASAEVLATRLRSAAPGTPEAALRDLVTGHGSTLDAAHVEQYLEATRDELAALRGVVMGGTWSPDELPGSTSRVVARLGLGDAEEGSIAAAAFERPALDAATLASRTEMTADLAVHVGEAAVEGLHAWHAAGAVAAGAAGAVPIALAVAAVGFGVWLEHGIEENRAERRETARAFGL